MRGFAQAKGLLAKTDPIDASVLHAFGQAIQPQPNVAPTQQQLRLGELVTRRAQLIKSRTAEANRSAHYLDRVLRRQARVYLRLLDRQVRECEKAIAQLIQEDETMRQRSDRLEQSLRGRSHYHGDSLG